MYMFRRSARATRTTFTNSEWIIYNNVLEFGLPNVIGLSFIPY